jgi:hypothetical protein
MMHEERPSGDEPTAEPTSCGNFGELIEAIDDVIVAFSAIADNAALQTGREMPTDVKRLDSMIYCLVGLFMPALNRWGRQHQEVIWRDSAPQRASPTFVFVGLLANVVNSALAARRLTITGFDRQARAVFRELTEVGDLLLVIIGDQEFLARYLASPEDFDKARDYWGTQLRPWKIREAVKLLASEASINGIWADPAAHWAARWELYAWLSKSAHVDYAALSVEALAADQEQRRNINIGGRVGTHSAVTLQRLCEYLQDFLIISSLLLAAKQQWNRDDPELYEPLLTIRACVENGQALFQKTSGKK